MSDKIAARNDGAISDWSTKTFFAAVNPPVDPNLLSKTPYHVFNVGP